MDTVNKQTNIAKRTEILLKMPNGRRLTSWLYTKRGELNSGPPKTNPSSGREEDLNPGPPDYKSCTLTTRPRCRVFLT